MAVKPVVNPFPKEKEQINRGEQISTRDMSPRNVGNDEKVVLPGTNFNNNYQVEVEDLDKTVINHINNVMNIKVNDNSELVSLPVIYGNQERWYNARVKGIYTDKNGSLILPLLMIKRSSIDFNDNLPSYKHDLTGDNIQIVRSTRWSSSNQYDKFSISQGIKPVHENIVTGVPQFVNVSYDIIGWTQYISQMNTVMESFSDQHNRYWGDNTSYKFLCNIEGGLKDAVEMSVGTERVVKLNLSISLKGYLLPETISNVIDKKRFNAKKTMGKRKLSFSEKIE